MNESASMLFLPELDDKTQRYDISKSYEWNYQNAPALPQDYILQPSERPWTLAGQPVNSPIAIAAGPLLNGRWVLHYAALGYDVLTYKTVRSRSWNCYPPPNLVPIDWNGAEADIYEAHDSMNGSWAVSFGMPSTSPDLWRFDVEETRRLLPKQKKLSVSVVATPSDGWSSDQLADDYAKCAYWAKESGADFVELNFSCPNVSTQCSQLYLDPTSSKLVTDCVRDRIGSTPLLIKVGQVPTDQIAATVAAMSSADALVMINCVAAQVRGSDTLMFSGESRGIAGEAIKLAVQDQVASFVAEIAKQGAALEVVAVGGISTKEDVQACLDLGASGIQLATSAM